MNYRIIKPSLALAPFIKYYWIMESNMKEGMKHVQRIVPNGLLEWTFYLKDLPDYVKNGKRQKSIAMINGQQYGYYDIEVRGKLDLFSIVFSPIGARYFFDFPLSEVTNISISADLLHKSFVNELINKMHDASSQSDKIKITESMLSKILKKDHLWDFERFSCLFQIINRFKGGIDVSDLVEHSCWSRKQFERNFINLVGISPKKYLRIIRFQHALHIKEHTPNINLTGLSMASNFYDQSHMINDFKQFSGLSPKTYFTDCPAYSDYFN